VFRNERQLLREGNVEVISYERFNDDIDDSSLHKRFKLALAGAWSGGTYDEIVSLLRKHRPHVAHFHNTFPLISPSAYAACQDNGVPVVQTLHNYRLICTNALLLRNGHPCEDCVGKSLLPALRYRCYRDSLLATGAVALMLATNRWRGSYSTLVDCYIALTKFAAGRLVSGGLPAERMTVKPNYLPDAPAVGGGRKNYAVYVGRLSHEKGVLTLLKAWKEITGLSLRILGDGPLCSEVKDYIAQHGLNVEVMGYRPQHEVLVTVRQATVLIVPSEWYEGFPMVVLEAYSCATPVIASAIGSLSEIIVHEKTGLLFEPGSARDLAEKVNSLVAHNLCRRLGREARKVFVEKYSAKRNFDLLLGIYRRVSDAKTSST